MQLEELTTSLGITQHMEALSNWRDALLREKAEELKTVADERDAIQGAFDAHKVSAEGALKAAAEKIQDPSLDDTATVQAIAAIVAEKNKTVAEREREALDRQIEELTAKREALK